MVQKQAELMSSLLSMEADSFCLQILYIFIHISVNTTAAGYRFIFQLSVCADYTSVIPIMFGLFTLQACVCVLHQAVTVLIY